MAITSPTKKDLQEQVESLQEQNQNLQSQVTDLQDELSQKAFALSDAEDGINKAYQAVQDSTQTARLLSFEREVTEALALNLEGMSHQFMWALSMLDSIVLYTANDPQVKETLLLLLQEQTADFVEAFVADDFLAEHMLRDLDDERNSLTDATRSVGLDDGLDLLSSLFKGLFGTDPIEQEVPDDIDDTGSFITSLFSDDSED